jgi:hypothetical protein
MEKAIDLKSIIEAETAKAVVSHTSGIRQATANKRKEDKETVLRTEGINIFVSDCDVICAFFQVL